MYSFAVLVRDVQADADTQAARDPQGSDRAIAASRSRRSSLANARSSDRDAISSRLMRYRNDRGDDWADIIDFITYHAPDIK